MTECWLGLEPLDNRPGPVPSAFAMSSGCRDSTNVRSKKNIALQVKNRINGRACIFDLARGIGYQNDVRGLLGKRTETFFTLTERVPFSFLQLTEVFLLLKS